MSTPPDSPAGRTERASAGSAMNPSARDRTILIVAAVFCASPRSSASSAAHWPAPAWSRMSSAGSALPSAHRATRRMSPPARAAAWNRHRR